MPKKTVEKIITSGNDYLIPVKGNQKLLLESIEQHSAASPLIDEHQEQERQKGRLENRHASVYNRDNLELAPAWSSIKQIIKMKRFGKRRKLNKRTKKEYKVATPYSDVTYYITNHTFDSAKVVLTLDKGYPLIILLRRFDIINLIYMVVKTRKN